MTTGILRVKLEGGSEVRTALRAVARAASQAAQANDTEARRAQRNAGTTTRAVNQQARAQEKAARDAAKAAERAEREIARAALRAAAAQQAAERASTRTAKAEANARAAAAVKEARERERAAEKATRQHDREERERTKITRREARERERAAEREARNTATAQRQGAARTNRRLNTVMGGLQRAGRVASAVGADMIGQTQDARMRRALAERVLGQTFFQTGADAGEVSDRVQSIRQFSADRGIAFDEVASALSAAQTQFSSLSEDDARMNPTQRAASRAARFQGALRTIEFARNTGNDSTEMLRLQGMLASSGFDQPMQDTMMRFTAGAAQRGSVEAGQLTREALSSIMRRMAGASAALPANATAESRQSAMANAFREHVAELQIQASFGNSPTRAGNAMASLSEALTGSSRQDKILQNIRSRRAASTNVDERNRLAALEGQLFEADPNRRGEHRLRQQMTNPLMFAERFFSTMGNDPTMMNNLFAGGGHGNPQAMLSNWRQMLGAMGAQDASGRTGAAKVRDIMTASMSQADIERGASIMQNDSLAQVTRQEERRDNLLTENNSHIARLNKEIQDLRSSMPVLSSLARAVGGDAGEMLIAQTANSYNNLSEGRGGILGAFGELVQGVTSGDMTRSIFGGGSRSNSPAQQPQNVVIQNATINNATMANNPQADALARARAATGVAAPPPEVRSRP